jgi:hypothetical protein
VLGMQMQAFLAQWAKGAEVAGRAVAAEQGPVALAQGAPVQEIPGLLVQENLAREIPVGAIPTRTIQDPVTLVREIQDRALQDRGTLVRDNLAPGIPVEAIPIRTILAPATLVRPIPDHRIQELGHLDRRIRVQGIRLQRILIRVAVIPATLAHLRQLER